MDPEVIYEDNHLLVVNKPCGLLTQPSGSLQESLEAVCKGWLKKKYNKPGNVFLEAVFRLDKPVSGLVIFAKTSKALSRLHASQREKGYQKTYLALLEKCPAATEGTLEHFLLHEDFYADVVDAKTPRAKLARLHYRVTHSSTAGTTVEVCLDTGRYHQIRVQFGAIGCPIVGDEKYGSHVRHSFPGIALHHYRLQFPHPVQEKVLTFETSPSWLKKYE